MVTFLLGLLIGLLFGVLGGIFLSICVAIWYTQDSEFKRILGNYLLEAENQAYTAGLKQKEQRNDSKKEQVIN